MPDSIWLGIIYLKEEGGYSLVLRALNHYKKRLATIGSSPELSEAPMFVQIIKQEAIKTIPKINFLMNQVTEGLKKPELLVKLEAEIPMLTKAMNSYHSDLTKSLNNSHRYYSELIPNPQDLKDDLTQTKTGLFKIQEFS